VSRRMKEMNKTEISDGLRRLGIVAGDRILVHSSLKSFGRVEGGPDAVIDALLEAVAPGGTVMVPTLTGRREDSAEHPPVFDVRNTPCWTGLIPETFRKRADAVRSLHPTHSAAAIGPQAELLTRDHLKSPTPCGPDSPYMRLSDLDGKVIFLGVTLYCCTLLHTVEELARSPYHLMPDPAPARITDYEGNAFTMVVVLHDWNTERRFEAIEPIWLEKGVMTKGRIGPSDIRIVRAKRAIEIALETLKAEPLFLCK
jgi:aminoglycoside 3-N-acetyltransferase